jgi:hypothetical protein
MSSQLDHVTVPSRDKEVAARQLAAVLDVPWGTSKAGPFCTVYVNDGLTVDFDETREPFPILHYCFRLPPAEFDAALQRLRDADIPFRSSAHGPDDCRIDTQHGGKIVYWTSPDGHYFELLTVSYARRPS